MPSSHPGCSRVPFENHKQNQAVGKKIPSHNLNKASEKSQVKLKFAKDMKEKMTGLETMSSVLEEEANLKCLVSVQFKLLRVVHSQFDQEANKHLLAASKTQETACGMMTLILWAVDIQKTQHLKNWETGDVLFGSSIDPR